jgi:putative acetyltransferase
MSVDEFQGDSDRGARVGAEWWLMAPGHDIELRAPASAGDYEAARALFGEYAESLGFSLDYQGFADELARFPGEYAPPTGALRLALVGGAAAGAVGLRRLEPDICEMKRLYVRPAYRALRMGQAGELSIGRALAGAIVSAGRELGYRRLRLDTVAGKMDAAIQLYRSLGFSEIPAYYSSPIQSTIYFELVL